MRALWLCNIAMSDTATSGTGTWLDAMARGLMSSGEVELGILSSGPVSVVTRQDYRELKQWLVPERESLASDGLPSAAVVNGIQEACKQFSPDLVHVWGTEGYWGLLTARRLLTAPALLEMQGLKQAIAGVYYGGLSLSERLRCIGIKELLKRSTMHSERRAFIRWGVLEREMICGHNFVNAQSPWMAAQVRAIHPDAHLFKADCALRTEFDCAAPWQWTEQPSVFTTSAYPTPFKGLHLAVRAIALLRRRFPGITLRIAGPHQRPGLRLDGYVRWINSLIRAEGLEKQVVWLGSLSAAQIVQQLQSAGAALMPSYVESYCLAMAEAMRIGTPVVSAFTGGTGHLGQDNQTCLFFPSGDVAMCAYQLERVLRDREQAERLSRQARETAAVRHDRANLVRRQIDTYRQVQMKTCRQGDTDGLREFDP